jgi:hypothetical protein
LAGLERVVHVGVGGVGALGGVGPAEQDVYGYATMRVFTDRQLRWDTAADKQTAPGTDYALRFIDAEWNQINHNLDDVTR